VGYILAYRAWVNSRRRYFGQFVWEWTFFIGRRAIFI